MKLNYYNNLGIGAVVLGMVLSHCKTLSLSKLCLAYPFISHQETLNYLAREGTKIKSIEKFIIDKTTYFSNFNKRYYDSLSFTFNALQYLEELNFIEIKDGSVNLIKDFEYNKKMGKRAGKIYKASKNIAFILNERSDKLYLNLRIEL